MQLTESYPHSKKAGSRVRRDDAWFSVVPVVGAGLPGHKLEDARARNDRHERASHTGLSKARPWGWEFRSMHHLCPERKQKGSAGCAAGCLDWLACISWHRA